MAGSWGGGLHEGTEEFLYVYVLELAVVVFVFGRDEVLARGIRQVGTRIQRVQEILHGGGPAVRDFLTASWLLSKVLLTLASSLASAWSSMVCAVGGMLRLFVRERTQDRFDAAERGWAGALAPSASPKTLKGQLRWCCGVWNARAARGNAQ